nr:unnamed protein product [Callosobruchus chinensis]
MDTTGERIRLFLIKAGALRCRKESTREMWTTNSSIHRQFLLRLFPEIDLRRFRYFCNSLIKLLEAKDEN